MPTAVTEAICKIKQAVGDLTGNKRLKREGERDERKAKSKAR